MHRTSRFLATTIMLAGVVSAGTLHAAAFDRATLSGDGYAPRVPVSALARPMAWFDPSRLKVATSVTVGSSFGGGSSALQVTRFSYNFGAPLWMNVNVGNAWGQGSPRGGSSFFLEGLDLGFQPMPGLTFQVHYRDVRSPLQVPNYGYGYGYGRGGFFGSERLP